jgi:oligopeptide/dipeptide ABC transporter ATP-binding protein
VTVQARVLDQLRVLRDELGLAMIFISHDLAVIGEVSDRVAVMYAGQIVECGETDSTFARPLHPYTAGLLSALPQLIQPGDRMSGIRGVVPPPHAWPKGCRFAKRCDFAADACSSAEPDLRLLDAREIRCARAELIKLRGI